MLLASSAFEQLTRHTTIGVALFDDEARFLGVNRALENMLGYSGAELVGRPCSDFTHPDDRPTDEVRARELLAGHAESFRYEKRYLSRHSGALHVLLDTVLVRDDDGKPAGFVSHVRDISDIRRMEQSLLAHEERWKLALKGGNHGVWDWNVKTNEAFFSPEWKRIIGYEDAELENRFEEWRDRIHPDDVERTLGDVRAYLDGLTQTYVNEHRLMGKDGIYRWILTRGELVSRDNAGEPLRFVGTHTDITWRKHTEASLRAQARHLSEQVMYDDLTGLPNRLLLLDRLRQAIAYHQRDRRRCALGIMEIAGLDEIKANVGHAARDAILRAVASRLGQDIQGVMTVARFSANRFAVMLTNAESHSLTQPVMDETVNWLADPVSWQGQALAFRVHMGVAFAPTDSGDSDELVHHAETALDNATRARTGVMFFDATMKSGEPFGGPAGWS